MTEAAAPFTEMGIRGLSSTDVAARRSGGSRNRVRPARPWLVRQVRPSLTQPLVLLLLLLGILYLILQQLQNAALIF
ncbi:MAG: hypothetical protein J2P45_29385, partial [Candidatus Dormibacteraeota bacterium]|nr:hypothetical protein [Candidatus Dormibacteraeota bacterium]